MTDVSSPESDLGLELIDLVDRASELVQASGVEPACEQFREPGPWFQGDSYVFVFDLEGRTLCHPSSPDLEGKNLLDLEDPLGKPIVRNILLEVQGESGDGWVHYLWPRPNKLTTTWKTAYVTKVVVGGGQEVVVGSGVYEIPMERFFIVEQVRDAVALVQELGEESFETLRDPSSGFLFYDAGILLRRDNGFRRPRRIAGRDCSA